MTELTTEQKTQIAGVKNTVLRQRLERFLMLSPTLKEYFLAEETADRLVAITEDKYKFPRDVRKEIAGIVGLVMLGEVPIKNFITELVKRTSIAEGDAREVAQDINERIFQPVREELLQVHGISQNSEPGMQNAESSAPHTEYEPHKEPHVTVPETQIPTDSTELQQAPPTPVQEDASRKREELLARLREAQNAPITPPPPLPPQEPEPPKPVTAAWNGKTIDLSKIPPRRTLNGNGNRNGEEEIRTVQLKKGPDGYWYEI